jgi:outer membrane protein OmpA-like peptidoglycan-associated protein
MAYAYRMLCFFISLALVVSVRGYAQEQTVVSENFSSNERFWFVGNNMGSANVTLEKGKYFIDRFLETGENAFTIDDYIDPQKDFSIEATIEIEECASNAYAGLIWNYADMNNFDAFTISGDGTFKVIAVRYGNFFDVADTITSHFAIQKRGKKNNLKVQRKGEEYLYFVNGQQVYVTSFPGLRYSSHGFYVLKKVKCNASSFIVRQSQQVNVVASFKAEKQNLGTNVNSLLNDSAPLISPDGSVLFFARELQGAHNADIWMSTRNKDGSWSSALHVDPPLNNKVFNSVVSCSPDNKSVLLLNTYFPDGSYKGCCFSISHFDGMSWSVPQDVIIEKLYTYGKWLDASLSADSRTMLLSVLRPGSIGYNDLYVSFLLEKGTWSEPISLGPTINTIFNEAGPFLAADNKTLYFSSLGYPGYGNQDIFMSKRLDDTWQNWSTPVNLGSKVNSTGFDAFFSIAANDSSAYLVSNAQSIGGTDIFQIPLPKELIPERVCLLTGKVLDNQSNTPLEAQLIYRSLNNEQVRGSIVSDVKNGTYHLILPDAGTYYISANKKGYYAQADSISFLGKGNQSLQKELIIRLDPLTVGKSLPIRQLYFEKTKSVILDTSLPALDNLYQLMKQNPQLKISIEGHTDNIGDVSLNQELSLQRAKAVEDYLLQKGIDEGRMTTVGYGGSKPIASNDREEMRKLNRRVEFTVVEE